MEHATAYIATEESSAHPDLQQIDKPDVRYADLSTPGCYRTVILPTPAPEVATLLEQELFSGLSISDMLKPAERFKLLTDYV